MTTRGQGCRAAIALAGLLAVAGVAHLVAPQPFDRIVPPPFPPRATTYASGVAELLLAGGIAVPRTRRPAALAAAALFLAVWPANWKMALDGGRFGPAPVWVTWARLPVQLPLIAWALGVARGAAAGGHRPAAHGAARHPTRAATRR